jgi:hypothetical protein
MFNDLILGLAVIGLFIWIIEFATADNREYPTWEDIAKQIKREKDDE